MGGGRCEEPKKQYEPVGQEVDPRSLSALTSEWYGEHRLISVTPNFLIYRRINGLLIFPWTFIL